MIGTSAMKELRTNFLSLLDRYCPRNFPHFVMGFGYEKNNDNNNNKNKLTTVKTKTRENLN